ncbi:MAG: NUDIX domain-containing protein [Firmicutes bacterium]|nr:NUDIX domain-containing protein [Bacillota bacterium]
MECGKYGVFIDAVTDPGLAACGIGILIIPCDEKNVICISDYVETTDLHQALSKALLMSLRELRKRNIREFEIFSDSEGLVQQLKGIYLMRDPLLKQLKNVMKTRFPKVDFKVNLIKFEDNTKANELAVKGLDKFKQKGAFASSPLSFVIEPEELKNQPTKPGIDVQRSAGGVVYKKDGDKYKICLIAKHNLKIWALPKGRVGEGESPEQTAVREVLEETGHRAEVKIKLDEIDYHFYWKENNTLYHKFVFFYLMPLLEENAQPRDDEADMVRWMTPGEAHKTVTYINEKDVIKKAWKILEQLA